ncbi:hypothetical protein BVI2075_930032 [Burkholderia vietnamiensis]|nr:hypothetical protein BVI2075_930032 [Burkholderia vietnamiensis]
MRAGAVHEGRARPARRGRLRPQAVSRGELLVRNARADRERRRARRTRARGRRRRRRDEAVHRQFREEQPRDLVRLGAARARRGAPVWRAAAGIVHAGHVRHLQGEARVGAGRDEAQRRHPPARDRSGHGAALLQQAAVGSRHRQIARNASSAVRARRVRTSIRRKIAIPWICG